MVSPHGIKLAVHLISTYFGDIVSKVCECLLRKGTLSLQQVLRYTELSKQNVTNALLVLIQHNCVQAFSIKQQGGFGEGEKIVINYIPLHDNIIHHMRFPKFQAMVSDEFGQECMEIFEGLLQHGRLSMNQIVDRHKDKHKSEESSSAADVVHENFNKLAQARYIERCPAHEPHIESKNDDPLSKKKAKKNEPPSQTVEEEALALATPMESLRFLVEVDFSTNSAPDDNSKKKATKEIVGEKRKKFETGATNENKEILWRVNFEEFTRRLRHKCIVNHVTTHIDSLAGIILSTIFDASRRDETKIKMDKTVPLSVDKIFEEAMKSEEGRSLTKVRVSESLNQLGCDISVIPKSGETHSIDLKKIIEEAQSEEVESIVMKKYSRDAFRIFRFLSQCKRLCDTDSIWTATFVDKKDALKILYQLWKDDFVHMERLASEGQKSSESLYWKLNKVAVWEQVLDDMYHAALNLKIRLAFELDRETEGLRLLVGEEADAKRKKMKDMWEVLDSSLVILDDAIMLFHDF